MNKPINELIEQCARGVADSLSDEIYDTGYENVSQLNRNDVKSRWDSYAAYLSDHRTVARYFAHVARYSSHVAGCEIDLSDLFHDLWHKSRMEPMAAIIALWQSVEPQPPRLEIESQKLTTKPAVSQIPGNVNDKEIEKEKNQ